MSSLVPGRRTARRRLLLCTALAGTAGALAPGAQAAGVVTTGTGADAAALQPTVASFRSALGPLNPSTGQSFPDGRREINWDGVPDALTGGTAFPPAFFSTTSPRGVLFSTPGTGFEVSLGAPARFGDIDASYAAHFTTFSAPRLFSPRGSTVTDVAFQVPGTQTPATTSAFGAVFTDVDTVTSSTLEAFDADGQLLQSVVAPALADGLSFAAVAFNAGERIARVRLTSGNKALAAPETGTDDLVALDDMLYAEPQALVPRVPAAPEGRVPGPAVTVQVPAPTPPDETAPRLSLLALPGFRAVLGASESCRYTATLTLNAKTAKRLRLKRILATHTSTVCVAGATVITSRLARRTVARLRAAKARPTLTVTARDAAGNARSVTLKLG